MASQTGHLRSLTKQKMDQAEDEPSLHKRKSFWQNKRNTFVPNGLNEREVPTI